MSRHVVVDGETSPVVPERLYCVTDKSQTSEVYAWSPDGEGFFWYDSYEEAMEQHEIDGPLPVYHVDEITDF